MRDRIESIGEILLAAAHADEHVEPAEIARIKEITSQIWSGGSAERLPLPEGLLARFSGFDLASFAIHRAVEPFLGSPVETKRRLIELVVSVHDADGELDYAEDAFVRRLGLELGLALEQFLDLLHAV